MKIKKYLFLLIIMLGSFYFINQEQSNLYREVKEKSKKKEIDSIDAVIKDKKIIPGKKGIKVDIEKTYRNMKKIGIYDETLTCFLEVSPSISISKIYDKYIEKGNPNKRMVSLIFTLYGEDNIVDYLKIINNSLNIIQINYWWLNEE